MPTTTTPGPNSTVLLEVELPPERLSRAIDAAVRALSRRTRVPGFRPGKAPRSVLERHLGDGVVLDEAVEHLVSDAYREAVLEQDLLPLTNPEVEIVTAVEGEPLVFKATVQVRPEVVLGDYKHFNFNPEVEAIDDARVSQVLEELRDQNATLAAVEDRGAKDGDYAVISFSGSRDGVPFEGGSSERMPLILGQERLIPGFEANLVGLRVGEGTEFDITFPEDYPETELAGCGRPLRGPVARTAREGPARAGRRLPAVRSATSPISKRLRADIKARLERNALDRARHGFADRIIEYAVANATLDLPEILVDQEVEVMHDEFRGTLARQGITEEAYLKAVDKTDADMHAEFRPGAEKRVRTLLVLSKVAEVEGVTVPDLEVEAEVARGRERYPDDARLQAYFDSERGRAYIRSTLRRSRVVEGLVDEWLAAHPDHGPLPHAKTARPPRSTGGRPLPTPRSGRRTPAPSSKMSPPPPADPHDS